MASAGTSAVRIIDSDNEVATVTSGRLDVNAVLSASDNIEIGNVDIKLNGTAVSPGADTMDNGTIRIALATDDTQFGEIGSAADADGNIHGQLLFIANSLSNQTTIASHLNTTQTVLSFAASTTGGQYAEGDGGFLATGVRNDTLASLVSVDHDHAPFQVNASGALYVEVASSATLSVNSHAVTNAGTFVVQEDGAALTALQLIDDTVATLGTTTYSETSTKGNVIGAVRNDVLAALAGTDGEIAPLQVNPDGALYTSAIIDTTAHANNAFNVASAVASASQSGIVPLVKMNEVVAAPSGHVDNDWTYLQTDLNGSLYTTHGITGGGDGTKLVLSAGSDLVLGPSVACKKVDIQAQTDNTGLIAVGFTGVDATVADGTGIILNPGDTYSLEISNLNLIYIDATVSGEGVRYTYFT